jgi:hypothetical protein
MKGVTDHGRSPDGRFTHLLSLLGETLEGRSDVSRTFKDILGRPTKRDGGHCGRMTRVSKVVEWRPPHDTSKLAQGHAVLVSTEGLS